MQTAHLHEVADACRLEHQVLQHIKAALRVTLDWRVPSVGVQRKLSSVRFTLKSFRRHLQRLMELEEEGGYLIGVVSEFKPRLKEEASRLRCDHDRFRRKLGEIVIEVDQINKASGARVEEICQEISTLLGCVDRHDRQEVGLLQEAALCDEGGEG